MNTRVSASLERKRLQDEQKNPLNRFATAQVTEHLTESGFAIVRERHIATVLFCDIRDFTAMSVSMASEAAVYLISTYFSLMFEAASSQGDHQFDGR